MAGRRASEERQEKEEERVIGVRRREDKGRLSTAPLTARSSAPRPYCRIWIEVHILPVGGASVCRIWTTLRRRACVRACAPAAPILQEQPIRPLGKLLPSQHCHRGRASKARSTHSRFPIGAGLDGVKRSTYCQFQQIDILSVPRSGPCWIPSFRSTYFPFPGPDVLRVA